MLPISETDFFHDIQFLQSITATIQEGVIILDQRGTIVSFNDQARNILNLRKDQLLDRSPTKSAWNAYRLDGSVVTSGELPVSVTLQTGEPQSNVILGVIAAENPLKWLSINSRMVKTADGEVFVFATFIDVTNLIISNQSLHSEQEKLKASEEKFSQSFHFSSIGMAIVSPAGLILDANEALCKMLGYTHAQLVQKTFQEITYPEDLEKDVEMVNRMLTREIETYQLEKRYIHREGHIVWTLLSVSLVLNSADEPQFFVSQVQEITEQKKLNKWLEDRNIELLKTQAALKRKIGQLKDFAGIITHDVRGPAGNIKRMLEIYETSTDDETKNTSFNYLKKISSDLTANLNELIHVLQIHLEKDIPNSDCDFTAITNSVCLQLQDTITQKKAQVITDFALPSISYRKIYLQSILYNLISNSLKYSHEGVAPVIRINSFVKDDQCYLTVSDNGLGLDMKKFGNSLFQFQKSFHPGFDSKGIGLYLVRNQVEDLGGSISAESEPGKGSLFTIRF